MIDLEKCKDEFLKYTEKYDLNNDNLKRKQLHSLRVMQKSRIIAKSLKLSEEEIQIATLIGLLHDIGRFEQYTKYNTFSDHNSIDHANLGVDILQENYYIKNYIEDENWINIILIAIKNHNKYKIEKGINKKKELFCKIIRDADKADIMYEGANIFWNKESEKINLENAKIRQEEIEAVKKHTLIDRRKIDKESELDGMLIMLCFIFDINYPATFEIIDKDEVVETIFKRFNFKDEETKEKMKEIRKDLKEYINKNKG